MECDKMPFADYWCRLFDLIKYHVDIQGVPRRYFFEVLYYHTTNEEERERLEYFASDEGVQDLNTYCQKERRSYIEVLEDFPNVKLPLERLLDVVPCIRPRLFSISSAPTNPALLSITVGIVSYLTPWQRPRTGLCTTWVAGLSSGDRVHVTLQQGLASPPHQNSPAVLIGPGTGVAPCRALALQRAVDGSAAETVLLVGFRSRSKD
eukprot:NODE_772_length_1462_cov_5.630573_g636_i0.p1 GENE.NODE_772_length_1462_cov_5.630573_g636_i0~~NODE_772_length_1462_cov_5.630573_g636_i0.p1  ORF type:complete len:207 (+),score=61.13 NODE_772_length_1462_cov_5.630573_g636_i0:518-1138(+)